MNCVLMRECVSVCVRHHTRAEREVILRGRFEREREREIHIYIERESVCVCAMCVCCGQ